MVDDLRDFRSGAYDRILRLIESTLLIIHREYWSGTKVAPLCSAQVIF